MAKRDVAWGFFYTSTSTWDYGERKLMSRASKEEAITARMVWGDANPGPIFRIAPPKPKPKRGRAGR